MPTNFNSNFKMSRVENSGTAGLVTLVTDVVDMDGFDGCAFVALLGNVADTSALTLTVQHGDASDGSDMADTTVAATFTADATSADNKVLSAEVFRPLKRYLRATLAATANADVDGILAIQTDPTNAPVTQGTTVAATAFGLHPSAA